MLPIICSVQSLERLASVEALPLLHTAPVVNIVIFELLKLLLDTVVCLNTSYFHIKTNQSM